MPTAPDRDPDPDELDPGHVGNTRPPDARPFVVALIGFVIVAVAAYVFLREDAGLRVIQPDEVSVVDDETVRATGMFGPCERIERAQVDRDDDTLFVEVLAGPLEGCDCDGDCSEESFDVLIALPEPLDERRVVPGVGRVELPCDSSGRCGPEQ